MSETRLPNEFSNGKLKSRNPPVENQGTPFTKDYYWRNSWNYRYEVKVVIGARFSNVEASIFIFPRCQTVAHTRSGPNYQLEEVTADWQERYKHSKAMETASMNPYSTSCTELE
ncbi:hypothetical protein VitviT2T_008277 [Vitis vinifera]|uniref:Amine oxidase n=1 Tax=Vitis vinifera TaxID=29760 RepID=A0ABY9C1T1_VITVI|nr:hypothetical protein VitviT2T_008277 [Vitis vinifera]